MIPHTMNRRSLVLGASAAIATTALANAVAARAEERSLPPIPSTSPGTDMAYWDAVRNLYSVSPKMTNLENGYWGIMPEPVKETFKQLTDFVNFENTLWARTKSDDALEDVRVAVAGALGADREEVALTRGATEALQKLIGGYNRLKPGDAVLFADLDYDSMQYAMNWLKDRRGADVVRFAIPEPASREAVMAAYEQQLKTNPRIRLMLATHISHRTGLMMPVKDLTALAASHNADVIVDAAHSFGQVDVKVADIGAPFIGFNMHKWINAPLGCGCLYIRKDRLADIDTDYDDEDWPKDDIRSRIHTGTANFATFLTIPTALKWHAEIGPAAKEARFRYLRNRWVGAARERVRGIEILTPDDPAMVAGITSFRLAGKTSAADNNAIVATLRDHYKVMTVRRGGIDKGQAIRITPAPYTSEEDVDRLVAALADYVS